MESEAAKEESVKERFASIADTLQSFTVRAENLQNELVVVKASGKKSQEDLTALEAEYAQEMTAVKLETGQVEKRLFAETERQGSAVKAALDSELAAHASNLEQTGSRLKQCEDTVNGLRAEAALCARSEDLRAAESRAQNSAAALAAGIENARGEILQEILLHESKAAQIASENFAPRSDFQQHLEQWGRMLPELRAVVLHRDQAWDVIHQLADTDKTRETQLRRLRRELDELRARLGGYPDLGRPPPLAPASVPTSAGKASDRS